MKQSPKEKCLSGLQERILTGALSPGSDLDETRIAAEYGLSRTPLREIFQRLAGEGYLQLEQNRGARVAALSLTEMKGVFRTGPLIHASIAHIAATNLDGDSLKALQRAGKQVEAAWPKDPMAANKALHAFHIALGHAANDPYMTPALQRLMIDETRLMLPLMQSKEKKLRKPARRSLQNIPLLLTAVEKGDAPKAVATAQEMSALKRDGLERLNAPSALKDTLMGSLSD